MIDDDWRDDQRRADDEDAEERTGTQLKALLILVVLDAEVLGEKADLAEAEFEQQNRDHQGADRHRHDEHEIPHGCAIPLLWVYPERNVHLCGRADNVVPQTSRPSFCRLCPLTLPISRPPSPAKERDVQSWRAKRA